jgi:hypothetical protein
MMRRPDPWQKLLSVKDRAALAVGERKWRKALAKEERALQSLKGDDFVLAAISYLGRLSSEKRTEKMLSMVRDRPQEEFWRIFLEVWSVCDNTWKSRQPLLHRLQNASAELSAIPYFSDACRAFFHSLPADVTVYRGCSKQRINGLSWSIDPVVAQGFARGHRGIPVPEPVLVTALAKKNQIFAVTNDRQEYEVICVPSQILQVDDLEDAQIVNWTAASYKPLC